MDYDLVIVGAGPAGLMAAKTALEQGLKAIVVERKGDISNIRRACCSHLVMDPGYSGEAIQVADQKIAFPNNGFDVGYTGATLNIEDKYFYSPKGHRIRFSHQDATPIGIKFDKGKLLKGLEDECRNRGASFLNSTAAYNAEDRGDHVQVDVRSKGNKSVVRAKKAILADGVNANLAQSLGLNKARKLYTTAFVIKYILEGVKGFQPGTWNFYFGRAYHSNAPFIMGPSLHGDGAVEVTLLGSKNRMPEAIFSDVTTKSPIAHMFKEMRVIDKHGATLKTFDSLKEPFLGNIMVIGDSAAFIEVETQGALMCGYHAAHAVANELDGKNGFKDYAKWWMKSFEFNREEHLKVAQGYALVPAYSDDELDYLFSLIEKEVLTGTFSQYKTPIVMWNAILQHEKEIAENKPDLYQKVSKLNEMKLSESFG